MNATNKTIRKAAIVVSSLEMDAADRLLDQMPNEMAIKVRNLMLEMEEISEEERQQVLNEFLGKKETTELPTEEVELALSSQAVDITYPDLSQKDHQTQAEQQQELIAPPFQYLNEAPVEILSPFFEAENPQMTAVVLSYLDASRAAEILKTLPTPLQADVLHRIVDLEETNPEVIEHLEKRLHDLVEHQKRTFERRKVGLTAAHSILAASDKTQASSLLHELQARGSKIAQQLPRSTENHHHQFNQPRATVQNSGTSNRAQNSVGKYNKSQKNPITKSDKQKDQSAKPQTKFVEFTHLEDQVLGQIIQVAEPQIILLSLAGADPAVKQRFCRGLSSYEVQKLDQRIRMLQPVLLSDIERAQEILCRLADKFLLGDAVSNNLKVSA